MNELRALTSEVTEPGRDEALLAAVNRSQAIVEFSVDGTVLTANEPFLKAVGYTLAEIQGRTDRLFCDPQYAKSPEYGQLWEKLARGEYVAGECQRYAKGGREIWFVACHHPVLGTNGKPTKVIQIATDITASRAELKVRTDIMNLTSIVSEANLRGDIMTVNEKFLQVSKYPREELIGKGHNTTRHPDMPKEVFKQMWATIGRGEIFRGIVKNRAKDGTNYYVDAVIAPIMGDNGKPKKYLGVRYDITATETERQNMLGVIRAIDATFIYSEFDTGGNVLACNRNFQALLEYPEGDAKGMHHGVFCDPAFRDSGEYSQFWPDLKAGKSRNGTFKHRSRSGKELWLQTIFSPVTDEVGRVTKIIQIATDVTEQQQMIASIEETAVTLGSASSELMAAATEMSGIALKNSQESESAATAADAVSVGVQTVATNMEEMVASIKEIGRSTSESADKARSTLSKAQASNLIITKLGTSSLEIGKVIKVITSIAQQTNLLALNATIEAARAGDAGKGFAVVANEVKELAKQTAKASEEITQKISAIQTDSKSAAEAIGGISEDVEKLNYYSGVIATAIEEQNATTNEISRVMVKSKTGVERIAETIKSASQAAKASKTNSDQTLTASTDLSHLAEKLTSLLSRTRKK